MFSGFDDREQSLTPVFKVFVNMVKYILKIKFKWIRNVEIIYKAFFPERMHSGDSVLLRESCRR